MDGSNIPNISPIGSLIAQHPQSTELYSFIQTLYFTVTYTDHILVTIRHGSIYKTLSPLGPSGVKWVWGLVLLLGLGFMVGFHVSPYYSCCCL